MLLMFDISVFHLSLSRNYIVFEVNDEVLEMCSFKEMQSILSNNRWGFRTILSCKSVLKIQREIVQISM